MAFLRYRIIFYGFSLALILVSVAALIWFGLPLGPEFRGGSLLEADFGGERISTEELAGRLREFGFKGVTIQPSGESKFILRFGSIDEATHSRLADALRRINGTFYEERFTAIGPALGRELLWRSAWGLLLAFVGILIYMAIVFRRSGGLHGFIGVGVLMHDVFITVGLVTVASRFYTLELSGVFIAALLTIAGYSINDTIIIFDRIREELRRSRAREFSETVVSAVRASLRRSVFTSLTTLLALVAIFLFGGATFKLFALTLIIGIVIGTYSSIAVASPLLYDLRRGAFR